MRFEEPEAQRKYVQAARRGWADLELGSLSSEHVPFLLEVTQQQKPRFATSATNPGSVPMVLPSCKCVCFVVCLFFL